MKQAPINHEFDMVLILLLWISTVLGVAVGSYWLSAIVQGTEVCRPRVPQGQDRPRHACANRWRKRY
ncbi:MAG TPA: hypothetical protein VGP68_01315, partial [Gemmataceae bacterium]|nr:hypothetical protein [Gemmataceae bacterium]